MKTKFSIIFMWLFTILFISCDKLDLYPEDSLSPTTYFKNENELQLYSNQFYYNILPTAADIYKDNADVLIVSPLDDEVTGQRIIPSTGGGWNWEALRSLNFLLENSHNCEDQDVRNKYDAITRFFRAYFYFKKVQRFGDVPWYDKVLDSSDAELLYKPRDSREFVMQKIIEDLDFAITTLSKEKELYRVSKWAALALKSRVCLFEGTFRKYHGIADYEKYLDACITASDDFMKNYDDPFESYYNILEKYVSLINTMPDDPNSVMGTSANIIPQTLYLKHELLAKFRLFKWMYQNKYIDCKSFEELDIPPKLVNIQKDYVAMTRHIHSIDYIWDNMIFQHLINDIQYFASLHLISDETKEEIKNELFLLADELEELAINGKTADGNRVRIYVSNINFEATYSYVDTNNLQMSLIRIYSINSITTMDNEIFCTLKEWIQSLKKFSTLISESGEMQRIQFFKQQREIIDAL